MTTDASKSTQCLTLLKHLKAGRSITQLGALRLYGIGRLASRVHDLKSAGHNILSEFEDVPTKHGKSRVKRYWLDC